MHNSDTDQEEDSNEIGDLTAERSFSALNSKRAKTWLMSSMVQDRLEWLLKMAVENNL